MNDSRQRNSTRLALVLTGSMYLVAGCTSPDDGEGTLRIAVYGESFVEDGIPAEEVVDGWAIEFDRFLISIDEIEVDGEGAAGGYVFDLAAPSGAAGHAIDERRVPSGGTIELAYRVAPPRDATPGNVGVDAVDLLTRSNAALYVEGTATRGDAIKSFAWAIGGDTTYFGCETAAPANADEVATSQITVHADHLFYDDLDLPEPDVSFDLIASADANDDDVVAPDELAAVDITALEAYQVGSREIDNLWDFIAAQSTTVGHIDGEGHCARSE